MEDGSTALLIADEDQIFGLSFASRLDAEKVQNLLLSGFATILGQTAAEVMYYGLPVGSGQVVPRR